MCAYGITRAVQGERTKQPQHKIETRLRKKCAQSPKPQAPCNNATYDSTLDQLASRKGSPCREFVMRKRRVSLKPRSLVTTSEAIGRYAHP